jgi:glycerol-3-phosphate dehydrogenase (NAD(P)+)
MSPVTKTPDIAIFGNGAWGTALAIAWARQGARVAIWGHPAESIREMASTCHHPRLPGATLPPSVHPFTEPHELFKAPLWISALPMQISPSVWRDRLLPLAGKHRPELLIHVSKGILIGTHERLSESLETMLGVPVGVLSGPSFADEVANNLPTTVVIALPRSVEDERAAQIQALLSTPRLRLYLSRDVVGVELCGALKNVLAIASGLVESLGLGNNARAALFTRGLVEMSRLVEKLGGNPETVMGLAGAGDLFLTSTGQSRNRHFGNLIGQGCSPEVAAESMQEQVIEGMSTTEAALELAAIHGVEMPITQEVALLVHGADPHEAVARLMQRSLKSE